MTASLRPRRGLFLDLDGTLADSLPVMREVYRVFLSRFGRESSEAEFQSLNGPPLRQVVRALQARHALPEPPAELLRQYEALIDGAYERVVPMSGAALLIKQAGESGWLVGVVTSNRAERTLAWLERNQLRSAVGLVVAGSEGKRGKPFPDPYLAALEAGGCEARSSLAVEDSAQGAAAAVAAGLRTFGYRPAGRGPQPWPPEIETIGDLAEIIPQLGSPSRP